MCGPGHASQGAYTGAALQEFPGLLQPPGWDACALSSMDALGLVQSCTGVFRPSPQLGCHAMLPYELMLTCRLAELASGNEYIQPGDCACFFGAGLGCGIQARWQPLGQRVR
jgi:hypothetical protein